MGSDENSGDRPVTSGGTRLGTESPVTGGGSESKSRSKELQPGLTVGEYEIQGKLGEGGMGTVYSAIHPLIGKKAAIKVISSALCEDESVVNRFIQEAKSVNQIGHPNIVDVFAIGELPDGRSYFIMEWLQGETLGERLEKGAMPLDDAVLVLAQVADALEAAHENDIVHRDLKPDNVFLVSVRGQRDMVKLLDFGIAKLANPGGSMAQTRTGMMMGTPGYMSPEQARAKAIDHRTDLYALGAMAFEVLCGTLPFDADNPMDMLMKHIAEPPPRPKSVWPEIPDALDDLLVRLLAKSPDDRPAIPEIREVLASVHGESQTTVPRQTLGSLATPVGFGVNRTTGGSAVRTHGPKTAPPAVVAASDDSLAKSRVGLWAAIAVIALVGVGAAVLASGGGEGAVATAQQSSVAQAPSIPEPPAPPEPAAAVEEAPAGTIEVSVSVATAAISVDGKVIADSANSASIPVGDAGEHSVVITADGYEEFSRTVTVSGGATVAVDATLTKIAKPAAESRSTHRRKKRSRASKGSSTTTKKKTRKKSGTYTLNPFE